MEHLTKDWLAGALRKYENKPQDVHRWALVESVNDDGSYQVKLDGTTPATCSNGCSANVGDVVLVLITADGKCVAVARRGGTIGGGGGGGIEYETDPTVPVWAKQPQKPTYTAAEVGADAKGAASSALAEAKAYADALVADIPSGGGGAEDVSNYIAGRVFAYAGADEPLGCLPCDGRAVDRVMYWELFDAIGTTYGAGDGSSTFNLPNIESRTIIGESDSYALGATGGEETHTLTIDEMPNHNHPINQHNNSGSASAWVGAVESRRVVQSTENIYSSGGGQPHNNMQPYIVMRYMITTGKAGRPSTGISPADYVLECGTSGIWTWRKYASGVAECWGSIAYSNVAFSALGNVHEGAVGRASYPFTFASRPHLTYSADNTSGNAVMCVEVATAGSTTQTPYFYLIKAVHTQNNSGFVDVHARGRCN